MRRREFIGLIGGAMVARPLAARAQQPQKQRRIAFIHSGIPVAEQTETSATYWIRTFFAELRRLGLVEGTNLVVERFSAEGSASRYAALAAEIVNAKPEVIVANSPERLNALITAIPIVAIMGDPVASGLVTNLARPDGNLTGVSIDGGPGMVAKRLQILKEVVPAAARIVTLVGSSAEVQRSSAVATKLMSEVDETHLRRVFAEMVEEKVDGVLIGEHGSFVANRSLIAELAAQHRLPVIYPYREYTEAGGLMAYGPDNGELAKRMALSVQQILNGAKPGDIPIHQPIKFVMALNMKTAKALGLAIPLAVLAQADEVIE
jgi:putative tryptophan/tyrosine transport system substrate-binding protein